MCYDAETLRGLMQFRAKKGLHMVSDEVYALSILEGEEGEGAEGKVETRGGGMVNKRLGFVSALEAVGGTVEGKEANDVNDADPAFDLSRLHVVWSLSKDLGSTGVRMVSCCSRCTRYYGLSCCQQQLFMSSSNHLTFASHLIRHSLVFLLLLSYFFPFLPPLPLAHT